VHGDGPAAGALEAEHEAEQGRLAAAVRSGHRDELAGRDDDRHVVEHGDARLVGERDPVERHRGVTRSAHAHPSARRSAARFASMTVT
jgi:hypothetical protein